MTTQTMSTEPSQIPSIHQEETTTKEDPSEATAYLSALLNKQLQIHTTDSRMFVGEFKCTDNECNIILSRAFEYRKPSSSAVRSALSSQQLLQRAERVERGERVEETEVAEQEQEETEQKQATIKLDMTSRFMGLIVVPGKHITRIEVGV